MNSEYWLISAPGDKTCQQTFDKMNNLTSKQNNLCNNHKFHIPDLKVGTLDQLVGLSDDLGKLDAYVEQITRKVANYLGEVLEDQRDKLHENLLANNSPGPPDESTKNRHPNKHRHSHQHHNNQQQQQQHHHNHNHHHHNHHHHHHNNHQQHSELTGKSSNLSNSRDTTTTTTSCSACHSGGGSLNNLSTTNDESEREFDFVMSPVSVCACDECFVTNACPAPPSTSATASTLVADECYSQTTSSMLNATRCAISTATAIATGSAATAAAAAAAATTSAYAASAASASASACATNNASASTTTLCSSAFFSSSAPAASVQHSISRSNSKKLNNNTCNVNNNKMSFKSSSHSSQLSQQQQQQDHHHHHNYHHHHHHQQQQQQQPHQPTHQHQQHQHQHMSQSQTQQQPHSPKAQQDSTEESATTDADGAALKGSSSLSDISDTFDWWFHRHKRNSKKSSKRSTTSQLNINNGFNLTPTHRSSPVSSCCGNSSQGRSSPDTDTGELPEFPLSPADLSVYITRFQWDMAKYPIKQSLRNIADIISKQIGQIDADLKTKSTAYNNLKGNLQNLEKKKTGSLMTRNLADLVKKEHFILDSEYLTTLLVIVPKALTNDWVANYEKITDMIVPRSSTLIQEDSDYSLFNVTLFKKVVEEFKLHARDRKFIVRDFVYNEEELAAGKNEMTKLMTDKKKQFGPLVRWLKVNFSEAFCALVHVKALRVFVESVLRYGLPVNFQAILIEPNKKSVKRLRDNLYQLYSHLDGAAAGHISSADNVDIPGLGFGQAEYYPYVFYKLNIDMVESAKI